MTNIPQQLLIPGLTLCIRMNICQIVSLGICAFSIKNKKQAVDLKHSQESLISNTVRQENVEDVNEAPNQKLKLVENVSKKYKSNPINSYVSSFH